MIERDQLIFMTQTCLQIERYEDMTQYLKQIISFGQDLSVEEKNLLNIAYNNLTHYRKNRILYSIEQQDFNNESQFYPIFRNYKQKIDQEIVKYCKELLSLLDSQLFKQAETPESRVYYFKMKGDYLKIYSQYIDGDLRLQIRKQAINAYQTGIQIAQSQLKPTNSIFLTLILNYSAFLYEMMNYTKEAYQIAKYAIDNIDHNIEDQLDQEQILMIKQIKDYLYLWNYELNDKYL